MPIWQVLLSGGRLWGYSVLWHGLAGSVGGRRSICSMPGPPTGLSMRREYRRLRWPPSVTCHTRWRARPRRTSSCALGARPDRRGTRRAAVAAPGGARRRAPGCEGTPRQAGSARRGIVELLAHRPGLGSARCCRRPSHAGGAERLAFDEEDVGVRLDLGWLRSRLRRRARHWLGGAFGRDGQGVSVRSARSRTQRLRDPRR